MTNYKKFLQHTPLVKGFFDTDSNTITYVVADEASKECLIIDSVMDFDQASGTTLFTSADTLITYVKEHEYTTKYIMETHVHADHLSAAPYLQEKLGGKLAISEHILTVQETFGKVFNEGTGFARNGSQFDILLQDGDMLSLGDIPIQALHTPGHTPADMIFIIGNSVFAGDTMFMPDFGTARCDFPGGSAKSLYASAQRIFTLPDEMRMFMCHDYLPKGRQEYQWETTIGAQKKHNLHLLNTEAYFIQMREARDATMSMPRLIIPSLQVNMRAGKLPQPEANEQVYLKTPINGAFSKK